MKFGSWTYDGLQVSLDIIFIFVMINTIIFSWIYNYKTNQAEISAALLPMASGIC